MEQTTGSQPVMRVAITPDELTELRLRAAQDGVPVAQLMAQIVRRFLAPESEASQ